LKGCPQAAFFYGINEKKRLSCTNMRGARGTNLQPKNNSSSFKLEIYSLEKESLKVIRAFKFSLDNLLSGL